MDLARSIASEIEPFEVGDCFYFKLEISMRLRISDDLQSRNGYIITLYISQLITNKSWGHTHVSKIKQLN